MQHGDFSFNGNMIYCEMSIKDQTLSIHQIHLMKMNECLLLEILILCHLKVEMVNKIK